MLDIMLLPDRLLIGAVKTYDEIKLLGAIEPAARIVNCWHEKVLVAYQGVDQIDGRDSAEWLEDFMFQKYHLESLEAAALELKEELQAQRIKDESTGDAQPLSVYLAAYEKLDNKTVPRIFNINNLQQDKPASKYYALYEVLDIEYRKKVTDFTEILTENLPETEQLLWIREENIPGSLAKTDLELRELYSANIADVYYWKSYLNFALVTAAAIQKTAAVYDKSALSSQIKSLNPEENN